MCDQTTTNICNQLAAQANELRIVEQHEATIAAALALPEADRYRLWKLLDEQSERRIYNRYRYMILIEEKIKAYVPRDERAWHDKETEKLIGMKWSFDEWLVEVKRLLVSPQAIDMSPFLAAWYEKDVPPEVAASRLNFYLKIDMKDFPQDYLVVQE